MRESPPAGSLDTVVAALLAGGASRRMGADKRTVTLGGLTLAERVASTLQEVGATARVQVGGTALGLHGWSILEDAWPAAGPAGGIATALLRFPGAIVVVSAIDLPFVSADLLRVALARLPGHDAAVPRHSGRWHPLAGAYSPRILPLLCRRLEQGQRSLQGLLEDAAVAAIEGVELQRLGDPGRLLFNVNTPEDLERARGWV